MNEFGIWTPNRGKLRGVVIAGSRSEAVTMVAKSWFSGASSFAEDAVGNAGPNRRGLPRGIYDQNGAPSHGAGGAP